LNGAGVARKNSDALPQNISRTASRPQAAEIKCERALALGDCYTLANAKVTASIALFAFREEDLDREIKRKPFDVDVEFVEGPPPETAR